MKLRRTTVLSGIESALREKILPLIADDFARNEVHLAASLVAVERDERDSMVALLVEEHDRLRALFGEASDVVDDPALSARLDMASSVSARLNLRISALEETTRALRELLVDLHRHVEARSDPSARALDAAIWRAIRETEDARNPAR